MTIDERALAAIGPWPWPRDRLAELVGAVRTAGARLVILDVLVADDAPGDDALAGVLREGPAILVAAMLDDGSGWILPRATLRESATVSHAGFLLDHDGVLRRLTTTQQAGGRSLPAVAVAAAAQLGGATIPVGQTLVPDFRTRTCDVPYISAIDLLSGASGSTKLENRAVFVGATALGLGDRTVTPSSPRTRPVPGVLVHATVTDAVLGGHLLKATPPLVSGLLALAIVLGVARLTRLGGGRRAVCEAILALAPLFLGALALIVVGLDLPIATLTLVTIVAAGVSEGRLAWLGWHHSGAVAELLAEPGSPSSLPSSPGERLARLERLAKSARTRREDAAEAQRVLAHELKTPLTSVRGLAQLLAEFDLAPEEQRRVAGMVGGEVDRLREMVDDILDIARLGEEARSPAVPTDLAVLVRARCAALAAGSGRTIDCDGPSSVLVLGDPGKLERVIDNLVGNAIKYSSGPSQVEVRMTIDENDAILEVTDHGRGIPTLEQERIFRRFVRGSSAAGTTGTGLGLALVSEVVTWHGGRIDVESTEGIGSTFRVVLPTAVRSPGG